MMLLITAPIALSDEAADETAAQKRKLVELMRMYEETGRFRGAALVALDGEILLADGYGLADERWGIRNTAETRFACASLSKQFTATTTLVLAQQGKLDLDRPIAAYLPDLREDIAGRITLRDLLTHTSGARREVFEDIEDLLVPHRSNQILESINSSGLRFEPGSEHAYSNVGYVIIRLIIETVEGTSFEDAVQRLVFDPAGMSNSGWQDPAKVIPSLAAGYDIIPSLV